MDFFWSFKLSRTFDKSTEASPAHQSSIWLQPFEQNPGRMGVPGHIKKVNVRTMTQAPKVDRESHPKMLFDVAQLCLKKTTNWLG